MQRPLDLREQVIALQKLRMRLSGDPLDGVGDRCLAIHQADLRLQRGVRLRAGIAVGHVDIVVAQEVPIQLPKFKRRLGLVHRQGPQPGQDAYEHTREPAPQQRPLVTADGLEVLLQQTRGLCLRFRVAVHRVVRVHHGGGNEAGLGAEFETAGESLSHLVSSFRQGCVAGLRNRSWVVAGRRSWALVVNQDAAGDADRGLDRALRSGLQTAVRHIQDVVGI